MIRKILPLTMLVALIFFCKPTAEKEKTYFKANVEEAQKLISTYPNFAPYLTETTKKVDDAFKQAQTVTNKDEQAKKMAEANEILQKDELFLKLKGYEGKVSETKRFLDKYPSGKKIVYKNKTTFDELNRALTKASQALTDGAAIITNSKPASKEAAVEDAKKAYELLYSASSAGDSVDRKLKQETKK